MCAMAVMSCGCQRTTFRAQFSPTVCVLGVELRSLGLVASNFTHYVISLTRKKILKHLQKIAFRESKQVIADACLLF